MDAIYEEFTVETNGGSEPDRKFTGYRIPTGYMISGRISGTALTDTGVVMHGHSQGERTRGHADCETFKFMVTAPATRALNVSGTTTETDKI